MSSTSVAAAELLWSTGDGLCLLTKRLERGRFARDGKVFLTPAQLAMLMEGIDWRQPKRLLNSLTMFNKHMPIFIMRVCIRNRLTAFWH